MIEKSEKAFWKNHFNCHFFVYKNHVYKNIEAQISLQIKNIRFISLEAISISLPASNEIETFF